jgi:hypothetical protein
VKRGVAALLLVASCAAPVAAPAYDVATSAELADPSEQAAALWTAAVPALALRTVPTCNGDAVCVAPVRGPSPSPGVVGQTDLAAPHRVHIYLDELAAVQQLTGVDYTAQTIAHELGHAMMGAEHLPAGALMARAVQEQADRPGADDVALFWRTR